MPSENQAGTDTGEYSTEQERHLATKDSSTLEAMIRGIESEDRCRKFLGAWNALDAEGENPPKRIQNAIVRRLEELK